MKQSALVTGGCGFIGSHVVDVLLEAGFSVHVVDDLSTGSTDNMNSSADYHIGSVLNQPFLDQCFAQSRPSFVFHLAALPRIQPSFDDPVGHDEVNVRAIFSIMEFSKKYSIKALVNSSSSAVYGNPTILPTPETASISPLSPYALQKYTAERYLHILSQWKNIPHVSLRYFNPYGPRSFNSKNPFNPYTSVVGIFKNQIDKKQDLTITGDGSQERDFIHVWDVARANLLAAQLIEKTNGNVYNIGSGTTMSILDLAKLFQVNYRFIPKREGEADITYADNALFKKLGWDVKIHLKEAIQNGWI